MSDALYYGAGAVPLPGQKTIDEALDSAAGRVRVRCGGCGQTLIAQGFGTVDVPYILDAHLPCHPEAGL